MTKKIFYIAFILVLTYSCSSNKKTKNAKDIKLERVQHVIEKVGFINLSMKFDANITNSINSKYDVDSKGLDSLLFDNDIHSIIGLLPDTTDYYAFLCHTIGDMLYPTIVTISKQGNKIDKQIICAGGCAGHGALDVKSCYDSIWIQKDLIITSTSKVIGTVETDDSIPKTLNICNKINVTGHIEKNGKIKLKQSNIIDCDDKNVK